jgi:drug/metabolite transporter (DMT)-like permease
MALALILALVAMFLYGTSTVMEAIGARRTDTAEGVDVTLFARLARQPLYIGALVVDAVGFACHLFALRTLPLFVVQAVIAGSVAVTAVTAAIVLRLRLRPRDWVALAAMVCGLGLLCASASGERAERMATGAELALLVGVAVVAGGAWIVARWRDPHGALGLAFFAGLGFAGTAIAERTLHIPPPFAHVVVNPVALALIGYGVFGMLLLASALQRGAVTATTAVMYAAETLVPALIGFAFLGDHTRPGFEAVAFVGFVVTLTASLSLAGYSETVEAKSRELQSATATS